MKYKIYISNNYFIMEAETGAVYTGPAGKVVVRNADVTAADPTYQFYNVVGLKNGEPVKLSNITKADATAYTAVDFKTFYEVNTGKSRAGGSAETTLTAEDYETLEQAGLTDPNTTYYLI